MFGAKLSWCQIVLVPNCPGAKLSTFIILVPNCPLLLSWCQIVWCQILQCQILWCQIVLQSKYLKQKIFVILKVRFHHEEGLSDSRYFELFFSTSYEAPSHKKSAFTEPPFLLFLMFGLISSNFVF